MNICVFCSANANIAPEYFNRTRQLGQWMAEQGHTLVFGGCNMGLMECIAQSAHEAGAMTVGIVPGIIERGGRVSDYVDVKVLCDNLNDRKQLMIEKSDAFIALPGGIGTLDEIFTVAASGTIGYHNKPVILYNIDHFWDTTIALLDDMQARGMIRGQWHDRIHIAETTDEIDVFLK